jgi:hypothetical protein
VLCDKTLKYDQLLDQKRRIEEIVNQMKCTEVFKYITIHFKIYLKYIIILHKIYNIVPKEHAQV